MNRNAIFDALFALGAAVRWGDPEQGWAESGRRLKMWDKAQYPSLFQIEPDETIVSTDGQLDKRTFNANWVIYHAAGKDQSSTPTTENNDIIDAVESGFRPTFPGARQTLGGLVYRAFISGRIHKDDGALDGIAMLIVPITIIVP